LYSTTFLHVSFFCSKILDFSTERTGKVVKGNHHASIWSNLFFGRFERNKLDLFA